MYGYYTFPKEQILEYGDSINVLMSGPVNGLLDFNSVKTINNQSIVGTGNINTTPQLNTINGQSLLGGDDIRTNIYCTCETPRTNIIKAIDIPNVSLIDGTHIWINFKNGHDAFVRSGDIAIKANITHGGGTLENVPILFKGINGGYTDTDVQNGYNGYYYQPIFGSGIYEFILCAPNTEISTWTLNFTGSHTSIKEPFIYMKLSSTTTGYITNICSVLREGIQVKFDYSITGEFAVVSNDLYPSDCSFEFTTGTTTTTLTYPSAWKWDHGISPVIRANKRYHVSVVNNCAVISEFPI